MCDQIGEFGDKVFGCSFKSVSESDLAVILLRSKIKFLSLHAENWTFWLHSDTESERLLIASTSTGIAHGKDRS